MPQTVILIHGTFAADAPWTQANSAITTSLESIPLTTIQVEKFLWSGRNSFSDRREAAARLVNRFRQLASDNQTTGIHLVAHSHGGNIAMLAVSEMGDSPSLIRSVCTLGTPFLLVKKKEWTSPKLLAITFSVWLLALYIAFGVNIDVIGAYAYVAVGAIVVFGLFFYRMLRVAAKKADETVRRHGTKETSSPNPVPILCISYSFDEANNWLRILSVFRVAERLVYLFSKFLSGVGLLQLFIIGIVLSLAAAFLSNGDIKLPFFELVIYSIAAMAFMLPSLSIIGTFISSHRFGLSGRLALHTIMLDVLVAKSPQFSCVERHMYSMTLGLLRAKRSGVLGIPTPHSLAYLDPLSVNQIRSFISDHLK
jgi:pimeloyl-ACP methyl ester carboxylesterase